MITLDDIKKEITTEIERINAISYTYSASYQTCKNYLENNVITKPEHFKNIDIWECIKCLYILKTKSNRSFEEIDYIFDNIKTSFTDIEAVIFNNILDLLLTIPNSKEEKVIYDFINEKSKIKSSFILADLYKIYNLKEFPVMFFEATLRLLRIINLNNQIINKILELIKEEKLLIYKLFYLIYVYKKVNEINEDNNIKIIFDKEVITFYNSISTFVTDEDKKAKEFDKEKEQTINSYYKALERLELASKDVEITNPNDIIKTIKNDNIKRSILKYIYYHNQSYYNQLQKNI